MDTELSSGLELEQVPSQYDVGKMNFAFSTNLDATLVDAIVLEQTGLEAGVHALFAKPFGFQIKSLFENERGENALALVLNSNGVNSIGDLMQVLKSLKQSKFETTLNIASFETFVTQIHSLEPSMRDNAKAAAIQLVAEWVQKAKASGLTEVDEKNVRLTLEIDQGKVKLNGKDVPEKEVQGALFILMFTLSGLGR